LKHSAAPRTAAHSFGIAG